MSDAAFAHRPSSMAVIWLHRSDDVKLREAIKIFLCHVLRVFDAEAAIRFAVSFHDVAIEIENDRNPLVSDSVSTQLQTCSIGPHHAILHQRERLHAVGQETTVVRLIAIRLEKIRRPRAQRAVRVGLHRTDTQVGAAKGVAKAQFDLVVHLRH